MFARSGISEIVCFNRTDNVVRRADLGEFEATSSSSSSSSRPAVVDVDVVEGNMAVIPCPGLPPSRPSALVEFLHNDVKLTTSGWSIRSE